jgi:hypothetical protein
MTDSPHLSPKIANKYVREKIENLLQGRDIYPLNRYGWTGPDTYDDEMIGHAIWQTDSLYFRFLDEHFSATHANGPAPAALEPWQQFLVTSGGDFEGLIEAARLSIGLVLFQCVTTERDHYAEDSLFQVHLISSMVLLGSASDRLRDLFIAAVFKKDTDQYVKDSIRDKKRHPTWYNAPFLEAAVFAREDALHGRESFALLPAFAYRIHELRELRNKVVHKTATELGRHQRDFAKKRVPDRVTEDFSYEEMIAYQSQLDADYRKRINDDVDTIVSWYELLIETSNHVFIIENTLRRLKSDTPK